MMANEGVCIVCGEPLKRMMWKTLRGNVCLDCYRRCRSCFACDAMIEKDKALRFFDGRYVCPACARYAVYEIMLAQIDRIKRRLTWFPKMPVTYRPMSQAMPPWRRKRKTLVFGYSKPIYESYQHQQLIVAHEIEILNGLPRELHDAVVVHELFHAWLHENFPEGSISQQGAEWLCEHMAILYLRARRASKPWRRVIKHRRDQYRFQRASEFQGKSQEQIIRLLLAEAAIKRKRRMICIK